MLYSVYPWCDVSDVRILATRQRMMLFYSLKYPKIKVLTKTMSFYFYLFYLSSRVYLFANSLSNQNVSYTLCLHFRVCSAMNMYSEITIIALQLEPVKCVTSLVNLRQWGELS